MAWDLISTLGEIQFAKSDNLVLLYLVPVFFVAGLGMAILKRRFRPPRTEGSIYPSVGTIKLWLILIIVLIPMIVAYADPYLPKGALTFNRGSVEIIFVVDNSSSMFLKDTGWARIDIASREIQNLLASRILRDGDRATLYAFGRTSLRRIHLSSDLDAFANKVQEIGRPTSLDSELYWGSDIVAALTRIYESLDRQDMLAEFDGREVENWQSKPRDNRFVIILTDGDFEMPGDSDEESKQKEALGNVMGEFRERGLKIFPVGVGTRQGDRLINILRDYPPNTYDSQLEKDLSDQVSRLNIPNLEYLRTATGSRGPFLVEYVDASAQGFLESVINEHRSIEVEPILSEDRQDLWLYFVLLVIIFFAIAIIFY